jgi:hypothetical protein
MSALAARLLDRLTSHAAGADTQMAMNEHSNNAAYQSDNA